MEKVNIKKRKRQRMTESKKLNLASFFFQIQINIFIIPSTGQYLSHYVKHPLVWPIKKAPLPPCLPKGRPVTWMSSPQFNLYSALLVGWCTSQTPYAKLFTNWQLSPLKDNAQHNVPPPPNLPGWAVKGKQPQCLATWEEKIVVTLLSGLMNHWPSCRKQELCFV